MWLTRRPTVLRRVRSRRQQGSTGFATSAVVWCTSAKACGNREGMIVAEGTPEQVAANPGSYIGEFLKPLLERSAAKAPAKKAWA